MKKTIYTAIGHLSREKDKSGMRYPVIEVNRRKYSVDVQERALLAVPYDG